MEMADVKKESIVSSEFENKIIKEGDEVSCDSIDNDDLTPDEQSIEWIRSKINLQNFNAYSDEQWNEEFEMQISDFLASRNLTRLLIYIHTETKKVILDTGDAPPPSSTQDQIQFFLKDSNVSLIKCEETRCHVQYGQLSGNRLESLLTMMNNVYLPSILGNVSWPKSVQKDLSEKLHKFMAALTESVNHQKGKTVLYVPKEQSIDGLSNLEADTLRVSILSNDTELVRRLESTLIHWTRQIEEMIKNQTMNAMDDGIGPLEEIEFWRARTIDLVSVREQLNKTGVKNIIFILRASASTYLDRFDNLAGSIEFGSKEANENLKYLMTLKEPCTELSQCEPKCIPKLLEDIILIIRMIWSTSDYYSSNDRLTSILRKVSNQIIIQCSKVINLDKILSSSSSSNGNQDINVQISKLRDSENCGIEWKAVFNEQRKMLCKKASNWNEVDPSSVFAQIDAFIQRCRDLLTVCNGQLQFCRNKDDEILHSFGGSKGGLIIKSLFEIEDAFLKHIEKLKSLRYDILDVNTTKWHEDYTFFKNGIKDLEVMMSNIINNAFDGISTVEDGIDLLSSFMQLSKTESMKQNIERKLSELYALSIESALRIKKDFDKYQNDEISNDNLPKFGGAAVWCLSLRQRLLKQINYLKYSLLLPSTKEKEEAMNVSNQVYDVLNVYLKEKHSEFDAKINKMDVEQGLESRLNKALLSRNHKNGHLICNFDEDLLRIFRETETWENYINLNLYQVPFAARQIAENAPNLRLLRENVMLVVDDFNKIIDALSGSERKLFNEHMKRVEKRLAPGLGKYSWNKKYIKEVFVKKCRVECQNVYKIVNDYHCNQEIINHECKKINNLLMILINKSQPQTVEQFKEKQLRHLMHCNKYLQKCWSKINECVGKMYKNFIGHPKDVQFEWKQIIKKLNKNIENSLKHCIKSSLLEFSRSINGDSSSKSDEKSVNISPLFKVSMVLNGEKSKINFTPSIVDLTKMVSAVSRSLLETSKNMKRIHIGMDDLNHDNDDDELFIFNVISKEEEIIKLFVAIMEGISSVATEIGSLITDFENNYKPIWDMDKDKFVQRMSHSKQALEAFDKHISRYKEREQDILHEETTYNVKFINVNLSDLKKNLVRHCKEWQFKLTNLLKKKALNELNEVCLFFTTNTKLICTTPNNLEELGNCIKLNDKLKEECKIIPTQFGPLEKKFACLEKFDVQITDEQIKTLASLQDKLEEFCKKLVISNENLSEAKAKMKIALQSELERFSHHVEKLRNEFLETGIKSAPMPSDGEPDVEWAFSVMKRFKKQLADDKAAARLIKIGLDIFHIEQPSYKDMNDTEKELKNLVIIWSLIKEWKNEKWNAWKNEKFCNLQLDDMMKEADDFFIKVMTLEKKMSEWEVWMVCKKTIENFKTLVPLIKNLQNPSMRSRHYAQLKKELNSEKIDIENGFADMTLNELHNLNIYKFEDVICGISLNANKECKIEQAIDNLNTIWMNLQIEMRVYKGEYFKIGSTQKLMQQLEEDQVSLSKMKSSPYFDTFCNEITLWVKILSDIGESIELVQQMSKQWIYLEAIFMGSDEMQRQLPTETASFNVINEEWKTMMNEWHKIKIAKTVCLIQGQFEKLNKIQCELEKIQRSLNDYLETKRMAFPRFYFLANDDLLCILGNAKQPNKIQKHVKKLFVGIFEFILKKPVQPKHSNAADSTNPNNQYWQVVGFKDVNGEEVHFINAVIVCGAVENWLLCVENAMKLTLQRQLQLTLSEIIVKPKKKSSENWINSSIGQLSILCCQISWTMECQKSLLALAKGKNSLKKLKKQWKKHLNLLASMLHKNEAKNKDLFCNKLQSLLCIEMHCRDIIEKLIKSPHCTSIHSFDWLSQLRFEYIKSDQHSPKDEQYGHAYALQNGNKFEYEYEYQGNNGRLVLTPLTDRCYLTLTTSLSLNLCCSLQGPAGSGKTETIKDLGKALGKNVVVFNCSNTLDEVTLGNWFAGLAQCGAWGCFDEFNAISIDVLSVVTQQIECILKGIAANENVFNFHGRQLRLNRNVGIFVTMNPNAPQKSELPDNLRAFFRPISMMKPDSMIIAEVLLQCEGFSQCKELGKKVVIFYDLMQKQMSNQQHYDFNLRAIISVLRRAGVILKKQRQNLENNVEENNQNQEDNEEFIIIQALKDMNLCKLLDEDIKLFNALLFDLFKGANNNQQNDEDAHYELLRKVVESEITKCNLQITEQFVTKIIQIYKALQTRHGNMIIGNTDTAKSASLKILKNALCTLHTMENGKYAKEFCAAQYQIINPKAVSLDNLYGHYDAITREWKDGILSATLRRMADSEKKSKDNCSKWLVLDGPVDTLWIESMNTALDDNKVLTLCNGDRIALPPSVSLIFEAENLSVASPSTVSRVGIVHFDDMLHWSVYLKTWLKKPKISAILGEKGTECLLNLFQEYVDSILAFKRKECTDLVSVTDFNAVQSLCNLLECNLTVENGVDKEDELFIKMVEYWFVFCLIWSIGASVIKEDRIKIDSFIRKQTSFSLPPLNTVYDYLINVEKKEWAFWSEQVNDEWRPSPNMSFNDILVPTVDTVRNQFIVNVLQQNAFPVLCVGQSGSGKSAQIKNLINNDTNSELDFNVFFNFNTSTNTKIFQSILDSKLTKHYGNTFVPKYGKQRLVVFIDDLNMPKKDLYGTQSPCEFLRYFMENQSWFDLDKCCSKNVDNLQLICAMTPTNGNVSKRLQSKFNLLNFTFADDKQIRYIFGTILNDKFVRENFESAVKSNVDALTKATLDLYKLCVADFLPIPPSKCHYAFNLRDFANVFYGLCNAHKTFCDSKDSLLKLWTHETMRTFYNRLIDEKDKKLFIKHIDDILKDHFDCSWLTLFNDTENKPLFSSFHAQTQNEKESAMCPYQQVSDYKKLHELISSKLPSTKMNVVLFKEAIFSICHIHRILTSKSGNANALFVGNASSGRRSLTQLASYIAGYKFVQIEVSKGYNQQNLYDDLRKIYIECGQHCVETVLFLNEEQMSKCFVMDAINNVLTNGEIFNLFSESELMPILNDLRSEYIKENIDLLTPNFDDLYKHFLKRVRTYLHVVICVKSGHNFPRSLTKNCCIKWFDYWPQSALREVASFYLSDIQSQIDSNKAMINQIIPSIFCNIHSFALSMSQRKECKYAHITPSNYLNLVNEYGKLIKIKKNQIENASSKLSNGLVKIDQGKKKVSEMSVNLEKMKLSLGKKQIECEKLLVAIIQQKREADEKRIKCQIEKGKSSKEELLCQQLADDANASLKEAMPALEAAISSLNSLSKEAVTEIKSYSKPPQIVANVMCAVLILLNVNDSSWQCAKKQLSNANFLSTLKDFDKDQIDSNILKKIQKYTKNESFCYENVSKKSIAAAAICKWVLAMEKYAQINEKIEPKRNALSKAKEDLKNKQETLRIIECELQTFEDEVVRLQSLLDENEREKNEYEQESANLELKLLRAGQLIEALSFERSVWETKIKKFKQSKKNLIGDCILCAAVLSYFGPFDATHRNELFEQINEKMNEYKIPQSVCFNFCNFLLFDSDCASLRRWRMCGLHCDDFNSENAVLALHKSKKFPLMIDPQNLANKWLKNVFAEKNLQIINYQNNNYVNDILNALKIGLPVLLQNVCGNELDASLNEILLRQFECRHDEINFFLTTPSSNAHFAPSVYTKTNVINFSVRPKGLQNHLLSVIVDAEEPKLESDKERCVQSINENKEKLDKLEDDILSYLNDCNGSLLDDDNLINALQQSKNSQNEIIEALKIAQETEKNIDAARENYVRSAQRGSILYFVLTDLSKIEFMYQYALDVYIESFKKSIADSRTDGNVIDDDEESDETESVDLEERIFRINEFHTRSIYQNVCRGLFEEHKLIFSFLICCKKLIYEDEKLQTDKYDFFISDFQKMSKMNNKNVNNANCDWLNDDIWQKIVILSKEFDSTFGDLVDSMNQNNRLWKEWFFDAEAESARFPGDWDNKLDEFDRLILIRCLRPDRIIFAAKHFIANNLGTFFVESAPFKFENILAETQCFEPIIFLSAQNSDDPSKQLHALSKNAKCGKLQSMSLGGSETNEKFIDSASKMVENCALNGDWIYFANCHLNIEYMTKLEQILTKIGDKMHSNFRLWISCKAHSKFPISLLQKSKKICIERPRTIKQNMKKIYCDHLKFLHIHQNLLTNESKQQSFKKFIFCLVFLHSLLLERAKFGKLGWNVSYRFSSSDFIAASQILFKFVQNAKNEKAEKWDWRSLRFMLCSVNYGGLISDNEDRRLLSVYIDSIFNAQMIKTANFALSDLDSAQNGIFMPDDGQKDASFKAYIEYIDALPVGDDDAMLFGQHSNADVAAYRHQTQSMLSTLSLFKNTEDSLQKIEEENEEKLSREAIICSICQKLFDSLPPLFEINNFNNVDAENECNPLHIVLIQECIRYNALLKIVQKSLQSCHDAMSGVIDLSKDIEQISNCLYNDKVPSHWMSASYSSVKSLSNWSIDLVARCEHFSEWLKKGKPKVFWLGAFMFPNALLTALMQLTARRQSVSIDSLCWDCSVINNRNDSDGQSIQMHPKEGAYINGLFLEGADWDFENGGNKLKDAKSMKMNTKMPLIHFKAIQMHSKRKNKKENNANCVNYYQCPIYVTPQRNECVCKINLKCGKKAKSYWIKRGTALLLSVE